MLMFPVNSGHVNKQAIGMLSLLCQGGEMTKYNFLCLKRLPLNLATATQSSVSERALSQSVRRPLSEVCPHAIFVYVDWLLYNPHNCSP